jgi:DNA-binding NarL/FixJ family response regulator
MITILIADDHPVFRQGLRNIVEADPDIKVSQEAATGTEVLRLLRQKRPDVVLLDLDMPELNGLDTARAMRTENLAVPIVFLTMHKEEDLFNEAMNVGAKGYVLKESSVADILNCVRAVAAGKHYISPAISDFLVRRGSAAETVASSLPGLSSLTPSERRILRLIGSGQTSKEIADQLGLSTRTVENHRTNICAKLNLRGVHSLVKFAFDNRSIL